MAGHSRPKDGVLCTPMSRPSRLGVQCPPDRDHRVTALSRRPGDDTSVSVLALVYQSPLLNPWHHLAQLGADLLDRMLGELGTRRLE